MIPFSTAPLLSTQWSGFRNVSIIRGDLLHPIVSGNKLYKLIPIFKKYTQSSETSVISVGGRYSNHLHALAYVAQAHNMHSVGIVQGYPDQPLTPTLKDCQRWGMTLHWVNKKDFQLRYQGAFWQKWQEQYPNSEVVLEGGWGEASIQGSQQWWSAIDFDTEFVVTAVGSGTTLAGLALSAPEHVKIIGVPVFNDPDDYRSLKQKLADVGVKEHQYDLWPQFQGKKFGVLSPEQGVFAEQFYQQNRIKLDPVYTAKVFHALHTQILNNKNLQNTKIAVLHTGGLQGLRK